jgi:hypothetical protein
MSEEIEQLKAFGEKFASKAGREELLLSKPVFQQIVAVLPLTAYKMTREN